MENSASHGEISEMDQEVNLVPHTQMIPPDSEVGTPTTCAGTSGPVVQSVSFTATNSTINVGCPIQGDNLVEPQSLKREEWSLLEEEYGDKSWLTPLPWEKEIRFDPEDYYVPLNLDDQGRDGRRPRSKEADLKNLFDTHVQGGARLPKRILLRGGAGSGKTTLCTKVALDWSWKKNSITSLPWNSSLLVCYKLKLFDSKNNIEDELFHFLYEKHTVVGKSVEVTRSTLRALGPNLVLFLDGYDEMDEEGKRKLEQLVKACKRSECFTFSSARLLVTSRPNDKKNFLDLFEKHYSIGNLSIDRKNTLVLRYFQKNSSKSEEFLLRHSTLELDEASPLTLFLLCWVSQHKTQDPLIKGGDLFFQCIVLLARRCNDRDNLKLTDIQLENFLFRFGHLCYTRLIGLSFMEHRLKNFFKCPRLVCLAKNMGILTLYPNSEPFPWYYAVHEMFLDSLTQHFLKSGSAICSDFEFLINDFLPILLTLCSDVTLNIDFPVNKKPVFAVKQKKGFEISTITGRLGINSPDSTKLGLSRPVLVIKCCPHKFNFVEEIIISWIVKEECPVEKEILLKYLTRTADTCTEKNKIVFENILDDRLQKLVKRIADLYKSHQEFSEIRFTLKELNQEKEFLISLTRSLEVLEDFRDVESLPVEEFFREIASNAELQAIPIKIERTAIKKLDNLKSRVSYKLRFLGPREMNREN